MRLGIKMGITCLFMMMFSFSSYAETITISLDLSAYDTFNETIEVAYTGEKSGSTVLNNFNSFTKDIDLEPGTYEITLTVRNDTLHLIQLSPEHFTVSAGDGRQEFLISVSDSAGLARGANDYIHSALEPEEEPEIDPGSSTIDLSTVYKWGGEETELGIIKITAPNITGMKTISYSLESGDATYSYLLYKENNFRASIELPYGRYTEVGFPEVVAEDEIEIPEGTIFEYAYYQDTYGKKYHLHAQQSNLENPPGMKLRVKTRDGGSSEIRNLYQFAGNRALLNQEAATVETGHYEVVETTEEIISTEADLETLQPEENNKSGIAIVLMCLFTVAIILTAIVGVNYVSKRKENHG